MILQVVVGGVGELNIGVQNGIRRQFKARGPVWGPTGPFFCSQHSKLKITDIGQPFVACPALQAPIQESHDHVMAPKCYSRLIQGLRKAATETRLMALEQGQQCTVSLLVRLQCSTSIICYRLHCSILLFLGQYSTQSNS